MPVFPTPNTPDIILAGIVSGHGLLPDGTKPWPEPMLVRTSGVASDYNTCSSHHHKYISLSVVRKVKQYEQIFQVIQHP